MPEALTVAGKTYARVPRMRVDSNGDVAVYRGAGTYLRLGSRAVINQYLDAHATLAAAHIPVAEIIMRGEIESLSYYVERSLGEKSFAQMFSEEYKKSGRVGDTAFGLFLHAAELYLRPQSTSPYASPDLEAFIRNTHAHTLQMELPAHARKIGDRVSQAIERIKAHPFVLSHGDFNPANMYPHGVIDIENVMRAPLGFDAVTASETQRWFLANEESSHFTHYAFTEEQCVLYRDMCSKIYAHEPKVMPAWEDLTFFRAMWMTARMQQWPETQKWRHERFIERFLS